MQVLTDNDADCDGTSTNEDCDDTDPNVYPGNNLEDGLLCVFDEDGDGYGSTNPPAGYDEGTDCDDTNNTLESIAQDNDCDGFDEYDENDNIIDCNDNNPDVYPGSNS